ncbi:hypothetical protein BH11VER1_BH11VER1_11740 [soil metagenome]
METATSKKKPFTPIVRKKEYPVNEHFTCTLGPSDRGAHDFSIDIQAKLTY